MTLSEGTMIIVIAIGFLLILTGCLLMAYGGNDNAYVMGSARILRALGVVLCIIGFIGTAILVN